VKIVLFIILLLSFVTITSLYISEEDGTLQAELKSVKHPDTSSLIRLHKKFSKINIDSNSLNLKEAIREVEEARKLYPLDDKLKTIAIELEHKRANQAY
jgi:ABC-type transporter Mla MlaB component